MPVRNGAMPEAPEGGHISHAGTLPAGAPTPGGAEPPAAGLPERAAEAAGAFDNGAAAGLAAGFVCDAD